MKKLILLAVLAVGTVVLGTNSDAKADHWNSCGPRYGGYSGYSYGSSFYAPSYSYYSYGPVNSFGYAYPSSGFYYGRPGLSISIGSGYGGYGYGYGGYGRSYGHRHHHH
jgi:hypothetical protein